MSETNLQRARRALVSASMCSPQMKEWAYALQSHLESLAEMGDGQSSSAQSSIAGHAPTPSGLSMATLAAPTANQLDDLKSFLLQAISGFFNSRLIMPPVLDTLSATSSMVQLTLRWPTTSGEIKDGHPGVADPNLAPVTDFDWDCGRKECGMSRQHVYGCSHYVATNCHHAIAVGGEGIFEADNPKFVVSTGTIRKCGLCNLVVSVKLEPLVAQALSSEAPTVPSSEEAAPVTVCPECGNVADGLSVAHKVTCSRFSLATPPTVSESGGGERCVDCTETYARGYGWRHQSGAHYWATEEDAIKIAAWRPPVPTPAVSRSSEGEVQTKEEPRW